MTPEEKRAILRRRTRLPSTLYDVYFDVEEKDGQVFVVPSTRGKLAGEPRDWWEPVSRA